MEIVYPICCGVDVHKRFLVVGLIKASLKTSPKTHVAARSFPSTQICPECGKLTKHPLEVRHYKCEYCGYYHPSRDQKSAISILMEAIREVP
jgi:ribosomal protein L32